MNDVETLFSGNSQRASKLGCAIRKSYTIYGKFARLFLWTNAMPLPSVCSLRLNFFSARLCSEKNIYKAWQLSFKSVLFSKIPAINFANCWGVHENALLGQFWGARRSAIALALLRNEALLSALIFQVLCDVGSFAVDGSVSWFLVGLRDVVRDQFVVGFGILFHCVVVGGFICRDEEHAWFLTWFLMSLLSFDCNVQLVYLNLMFWTIRCISSSKCFSSSMCGGDLCDLNPQVSFRFASDRRKWNAFQCIRRSRWPRTPHHTPSKVVTPIQRRTMGEEILQQQVRCNHGLSR